MPYAKHQHTQYYGIPWDLVDEERPRNALAWQNAVPRRIRVYAVGLAGFGIVQDFPRRPIIT